jgi:hypothetical protein
MYSLKHSKNTHQLMFISNRIIRMLPYVNVSIIIIFTMHLLNTTIINHCLIQIIHFVLPLILFNTDIIFLEPFFM